MRLNKFWTIYFKYHPSNCLSLCINTICTDATASDKKHLRWAYMLIAHPVMNISNLFWTFSNYYFKGHSGNEQLNFCCGYLLLYCFRFSADNMFVLNNSIPIYWGHFSILQVTFFIFWELYTIVFLFHTF